MITLFGNSSAKVRNEGIFGPKFLHFCFFAKFSNHASTRVLILFNMIMSFFKFFAQKYPSKALLVPNLDIFLFLQNFAVRKIWGCWFQIWQYSGSKILVPKYPYKAFLVPTLEIFVFLWEIFQLDKF